ncbi:MAG: tRNA (N6-threonylcarbamoyladenosine(37)-N6)-methyltransferase TrmO [Promethearchaeota archaeon]
MELRASVVGVVRKLNANSVYLEIDSEYWDAVLNLDKFSHAIILWWIHKQDNPEARSNLRDFPPQEDAELSGVFASRSPARPTPIGLSIVAITHVDDKTRRIWIDQIDAIDGTPIIDIKPYMPSSDRVDEARVPKWFERNVPRYTS